MEEPQQSTPVPPEEQQGEGSPAWGTQIRPLKGFSLGSIYVGKPPPKRQGKGGKKWVPPKVPMEAPKSCRDSGFTPNTCFNCIRATCVFDDQTERINRKRKLTKTQRRQMEEEEKK